MPRSPFDVSDILLQGGNIGQIWGRGIENAASGLAGGIEKYTQIKDRNKQLQGTVDSTSKFLEAASKMEGLPAGLKAFAANLGTQLHDPNVPLSQKASLAQQASQNIGQYMQLGQAAVQEQERMKQAQVMQKLQMMNQFPGGGAGVLNPQAMQQVAANRANPMMAAASQLYGATGQVASPAVLADYAAKVEAINAKPSQGQLVSNEQFNAWKQQGLDVKAVPNPSGGWLVKEVGTYAPKADTIIKTGDDVVARQLFSSMSDMQVKAQQAASTLRSISVAKDILDNKEFIAGAMAEPRLFATKLANALGYEGDEAQNTEVLRSQIAMPVFQILKNLGSGSGITDKDLQFAQKVAGGEISLEPDTIKRLVSLGQKAANLQVKAYNQRLEKVYPKDNADYAQARNFFELTPAETETEMVQPTKSTVGSAFTPPPGWSIRK